MKKWRSLHDRLVLFTSQIYSIRVNSYILFARILCHRAIVSEIGLLYCSHLRFDSFNQNWTDQTQSFLLLVV